jgi:transposase-like protein
VTAGYSSAQVDGDPDLDRHRGLRARRACPHGKWHLDEMMVMIKGKRHHLWRAVDAEGEVLDFLVQSR